ncbi:hypothetical protein B0J17DRAFT_433861 [Rhizoctonia solani]|nr:hypothetical protein B0J17DRAFT_433861 [Rhizoctonia solani]
MSGFHLHCDKSRSHHRFDTSDFLLRCDRYHSRRRYDKYAHHSWESRSGTSGFHCVSLRYVSLPALRAVSLGAALRAVSLLYVSLRPASLPPSLLYVCDPPKTWDPAPLRCEPEAKLPVPLAALLVGELGLKGLPVREGKDGVNRASKPRPTPAPRGRENGDATDEPPASDPVHPSIPQSKTTTKRLTTSNITSTATSTSTSTCIRPSRQPNTQLAGTNASHTLGGITATF